MLEERRILRLRYIADSEVDLDEVDLLATAPYVGHEPGAYHRRNHRQAREADRIHRGSCSLGITGEVPTRLRGHYWTDRNSSGELDYAVRSSQMAEDFDRAVRLFTMADAQGGHQ